MKDDQSRILSGKGNFHTIDLRWQRSLRNELAGEIMVTQAVVPLQIEPQASRCTPAQEVTIQKDGISISMHGVSSDMVIAIVRGLSSC